jgi:MinD superfamily P-loop ATPase
MIFDKANTIKIAEKRCLNQRHEAVECNHCSENCPSDAIIIYNKHVLLDKEECGGCGLCLSDCPTQVFQAEQWDETSIVRDVVEEGWKVTEFFCGEHTSPFKKEKNRDRGAVQIPACLSVISRGAWYELGLKTEIELHLEECDDCPLKKALARLEYDIGMASEWLEASGHSAKFSTISQSSIGKTKRSLRAIETGLKISSRRDLFLSLISKGKQTLGSIAYKGKSFSNKFDEVPRESLVADWQKRLAKVYTENMVEGSPPAYWPTIKKSKDCINCGMCSAVCPSKTLQIVVNNTTCSHYFTNGLCLDCRICQLFCPKEAISRDREKVEKPFEVKTIVAAPVITCQRCNSFTFKNQDHLCYWCKEEAEIDYSLMKSCRNLFLKTEN